MGYYSKASEEIIVSIYFTVWLFLFTIVWSGLIRDYNLNKYFVEYAKEYDYLVNNWVSTKTIIVEKKTYSINYLKVSWTRYNPGFSTDTLTKKSINYFYTVEWNTYSGNLLDDGTILFLNSDEYNVLFDPIEPTKSIIDNFYTYNIHKKFINTSSPDRLTLFFKSKFSIFISIISMFFFSYSLLLFIKLSLRLKLLSIAYIFLILSLYYYLYKDIILFTLKWTI